MQSARCDKLEYAPNLNFGPTFSPRAACGTGGFLKLCTIGIGSHKVKVAENVDAIIIQSKNIYFWLNSFGS